MWARVHTQVLSTRVGHQTHLTFWRHVKEVSVSPHAGGQGGTLGHKPIGLCLHRHSMSKCNPQPPCDRGHWGNIAVQIARQIPKAMCTPASLQGHSGDHAEKIQPYPVYLNGRFLGFPSTGPDSRPRWQSTSAGVLGSNLGLLCLMAPFHASLVM